MTAAAIGKVWANDANTASAPGRVQFDAAVQETRRVAHVLAAYVRNDNVLDRDIVGSVIVNEADERYFEPAPGRRWLAGVRTTIGR